MAFAETEPQEFARAAGAEPIAGYKLIAPLGKGGFGEVWKCEVPGGLHKAMKFIAANHDLDDSGDPAQQELESLQRIKGIRHPFMVSMERVELIDDGLLIVMELADKNLAEVLADCHSAGKPGIPRDELLAFLHEAAEVLDFMNIEHRLQHLDIKPRNLFLIGKHIKVADFGMVSSLGYRKSGLADCGISPLYAAPEVFNGKLSDHCDQYSLAITYQELLTGTFPIQGKNARQLMLNHLTVEPNVAALPVADRALVARALAKDPAQRFACCLDFVASLEKGKPTTTVRVSESAPAPEAAAAAAPPAPPAEPEPVQDMGQTQIASQIESEVGAARYLAPEDLIPGYKLLECVGPNPLGDWWRVQGPGGRERLAQLLNTPSANGPALVAKLKQIRHLALPNPDILRSPSGRVFLVFDVSAQPLRERFQECRGEGQRGIPRDELIGYLRPAADALDELSQKHGLAHLCLNPRNLLVKEDGIQIFEFGLVSLLWAPLGKPAGSLNARYAAPEMFERKPPTGAADQYSLALIYAEMLTGVHPRPTRASNRPSASRAPVKLDLDLLPVFDRAIVARALHADPQQRFASCSDFVSALEDAARSADPEANNPFRKLPAVIPLATLRGDTTPPGSQPTVERFVTDIILVTHEALEIGEFNNLRYLLREGNVIEHRCPIRMIPGGLRLKLHDFPKQWSAQLLKQDDSTFLCRIPARRTVWQRCFGGESGMEVHVLLQALAEPVPQMVEAIVRIQPYGATDRGLVKDLTQVGPALIESLRTYLQAEPDQREKERWPCAQRLHLYPVYPDLQVGEPIEADAQNISLTGIGFRTSEQIPTEHLYVNFPSAAPLTTLAIRARILRSQPGARGHEVGAVFGNESQ